jgi:hypothetical protein
MFDKLRNCHFISQKRIDFLSAINNCPCPQALLACAPEILQMNRAQIATRDCVKDSVPSLETFDTSQMGYHRIGTLLSRESKLDIAFHSLSSKCCINRRFLGESRNHEALKKSIKVDAKLREKE